MYHVIYLTGAPASGKSTLSRRMRDAIPNLAVFEYGKELTQYLAAHGHDGLTQTSLRERSSSVATADDIAAVDQRLLTFVSEQRKRQAVVIDSHAVTKEAFGFRVTAYSLDDIRRLAPTTVVMLYTSPLVTVERISADADGRPVISEWEAGFHTALQSSVAIAYATQVGVPLYLLDSARPESDLIEEMRRLISKPVRGRSLEAV